MSVDFDRRSFLKGFAALSGTLAMPGFVAKSAASVLELTTKEIPDYEDWKDIFRLYRNLTRLHSHKFLYT